MAQQTWTILDTTLENDRVKVSDSYTKDGASKLTTFTQDNLTGRVKLVQSSADNTLNRLYYSIDSNGFIDYYIEEGVGSGKFKKYGSIQEIADAGIFGYSARTTALIKNSMQGELENSADANDVTGSTTANPNNSVNNDGNTSNNGTDADEEGDENNEGSTPIPESSFSLTIEGPENKPSGRFRYPENIGAVTSKNLDRIKFVQAKYVGVELNGTGGGLTSGALSERQYEIYNDSSVVIGIQPTISDSNQVRWNGGNLDQLRAFAARTSLNAMQQDGITEAGQSILKAGQEVIKEVGKDSNIGNALNTLFAGKAVGVGGQLLSRVTGAILNPNLELLFEGPTLRSFNYTFKMSAENSAEATSIKNIIRWFKKGMAVKKASGELFLTAPNVFKIKYIKGVDSVSENDDHDSINKLKYCALLDAKVNYTPEGNYSTYTDGTMSMYELSLSFGEINPIYAEDYNDAHPIGY